jgi:hypothetical protein
LYFKKSFLQLAAGNFRTKGAANKSKFGFAHLHLNNSQSPVANR